MFLSTKQKFRFCCLVRFLFIFKISQQSDGFSTLKGELLPFIIKKQMSRPGLSSNEFDKPFSIVNVNVKNDDIFNVSHVAFFFSVGKYYYIFPIPHPQFVNASDLQSKITATSLYNDSNTKGAYNADVIRCYATRAPDTVFGIRVNTTLGYCAANQKVKHMTLKRKKRTDLIY